MFIKHLVMKLLSWNFHVLNNGKPVNPIYSYCSRAKNKNHSMIQTYPQIMGKNIRTSFIITLDWGVFIRMRVPLPQIWLRSQRVLRWPPKTAKKSQPSTKSSGLVACKPSSQWIGVRENLRGKPWIFPLKYGALTI